MPKTVDTLPKVSFIIPTLNAAFILPRCLKAIRNQDYPQTKIEIVIADGGSSDKTIAIAKKYKAKVIPNPEILHEMGKDRASKVAKGEVFFFTDADNILARPSWVRSMVTPFLENKNVKGFLPQTTPAPDSNSLDQYLGNLFTDPFTWFVYGNAANPQTYERIYQPLKKTSQYTLYKFPKNNPPLFGLSQGVGTVSNFKRGSMGHSDDLLAGIKLIREGGTIAYVPGAKIYHYHVTGLTNFINKYRWRIRNNFKQKFKGMGLVNRQQYLPTSRKLRQVLFIPYSLSILFPILDSIYLTIRYKNIIMLWHPLVCFILGLTIILEGVKFKLGFIPVIKTYGQ